VMSLSGSFRLDNLLSELNARGFMTQMLAPPQGVQELYGGNLSNIVLVGRPEVEGTYIAVPVTAEGETAVPLGALYAVSIRKLARLLAKILKRLGFNVSESELAENLKKSRYASGEVIIIVPTLDYLAELLQPYNIPNEKLATILTLLLTELMNELPIQAIGIPILP